MYLFLFLLAIIIFLFIIVLIIPLILFFEFNSEKNDMQLSIFWLHKFIKAVIKVNNTKPTLSVYVFEKLLFTRTLKANKKRNTRQLLKLLKLEDSYVRAYYGMRNPNSVVMTYGILQFITTFLAIESVSEFPDFLAADDYLIINAGANLNMRISLSNYLRMLSSKELKE